MARFRRLIGKSKAALLLVAVVLALACGMPGGADLDVRMDQAGGHALLQLGLATISVAFESGRSCSNSNSCAGLRLGMQ
jgi:hypothetical protein